MPQRWARFSRVGRVAPILPVRRGLALWPENRPGRARAPALAGSGATGPGTSPVTATRIRWPIASRTDGCSRGEARAGNRSAIQPRGCCGRPGCFRRRGLPRWAKQPDFDRPARERSGERSGSDLLAREGGRVPSRLAARLPPRMGRRNRGGTRNRDTRRRVCRSRPGRETHRCGTPRGTGSSPCLDADQADPDDQDRDVCPGRWWSLRGIGTRGDWETLSPRVHPQPPRRRRLRPARPAPRCAEWLTLRRTALAPRHLPLSARKWSKPMSRSRMGVWVEQMREWMGRGDLRRSLRIVL